MNSNADLDNSRTLFNNLLFFAMHRPDAREKGEFRYVSADWIGLPGWFFWPKNRLGVFLLKFQEAFSSTSKQHLTTVCRLFYYPSLDEPLFENFSCSEQLLRASDSFSRLGVDFSTECPHCECVEGAFKDLENGKGIPTPEARQRIAAALFAVGEINLVWLEDDLQRVEVKAPVRDQSWAKDAVDVLTENGPVRLLEAAALDRDLPCWELTSGFADDLVRFLPVDILQQSDPQALGNESSFSSYGLRQTRCRTTGILAEYAKV